MLGRVDAAVSPGGGGMSTGTAEMGYVGTDVSRAFAKFDMESRRGVRTIPR